MNHEREKSVLVNLTNTFNFVHAEDGAPGRWFFCFGTLKEYACQRTFSFDYDIDIGLLYEEAHPDEVRRMVEGSGYRMTKVLLHDQHKKPLNMHFKPVHPKLEGTPTIDVYFWYPAGAYLFHTYDVLKEGRDVPSRYVFKGVPREWIVAPAADVKRRRTQTSTNIEADRLLDTTGCWHFPIFDMMGDAYFKAPYAVGALLDEWYPAWVIRDAYKGQSQSRWTYNVRSCKELEHAVLHG